MRKLIVVSIIIIFILISCSSLLYFEYIEKEYHPDYEKIIFEIDAGEDQIGYSNISVRFNVSISEENHAYDYYSWDFNGDGIEEENKSFTSIIPTLLCCSHYNYTKIGIYYATVKLADTHGLIAEDTCMVTIFPFELRFEISMTNSTFKSTESILVNSSLFNSHEYLTVKIEEMWIERGSLNYHITTPDDKVFFFRGPWVSSIPNVYELTSLSYLNETTDITNPKFGFGNFEIKGEYRIYATYGGGSWELETWQGKLISNELSFWII